MKELISGRFTYIINLLPFNKKSKSNDNLIDNFYEISNNEDQLIA
jgi:hypothetical protein